jgi:hypothetical protein
LLRAKLLLSKASPAQPLHPGGAVSIDAQAKAAVKAELGEKGKGKKKGDAPEVPS